MADLVVSGSRSYSDMGAHSHRRFAIIGIQSFRITAEMSLSARFRAWSFFIFCHPTGKLVSCKLLPCSILGHQEPGVSCRISASMGATQTSTSDAAQAVQLPKLSHIAPFSGQSTAELIVVEIPEQARGSKGPLSQKAHVYPRLSHSAAASIVAARNASAQGRFPTPHFEWRRLTHRYSRRDRVPHAGGRSPVSRFSCRSLMQGVRRQCPALGAWKRHAKHTYMTLRLESLPHPAGSGPLSSLPHRYTSCMLTRDAHGPGISPTKRFLRRYLSACFDLVSKCEGPSGTVKPPHSRSPGNVHVS